MLSHFHFARDRGREKEPIDDPRCQRPQVVHAVQAVS